MTEQNGNTRENPEEFYKKVEEAAREGAREGARSGSGGRVSGIVGLFRLILMLLPIVLMVLLFIRFQSFTGNIKEIFERENPVEEHDLTLENHGVLGFTAADFQEAILGESRQSKILEVYTINVSEAVQLTRAGLANLKIFSKNQLITYHGDATYTVDLGQLSKDDITLKDDDKEKKVYLVIPLPKLKEINIPENKIEYGDLKKGFLAIGDLKLTPQQITEVQNAARKKMEEKLEQENVMETAERFAKMSVWEIYQPIIDGVTSGYSLEVEFEQ